jgi:hypothetical protein
LKSNKTAQPMKPFLKWTDKQSQDALYAFPKLNLKKIVHAVQVVVVSVVAAADALVAAADTVAVDALVAAADTAAVDALVAAADMAAVTVVATAAETTNFPKH